MHGIWKSDSKYAKVDGADSCCRKAGIIPPSWNDDINNNVRSASVPNQDSFISAEEFHELCSTMIRVHVGSIIAASKRPSVCSTSPAPDASFITEHDAMTLQNNEWTDMIHNWMDIEDNKDLINEELGEVWESIDNNVVEVEEDKAEKEDTDEVRTPNDAHIILKWEALEKYMF